jgi:hypothetical protein
MDFNSLSEIMTPSDAVGHLVEAGMPQHEAKDRIDFYVNHVNPGWASKNWTSADESRHMYDRAMNQDSKEEPEPFSPFTVDDLADEADEERAHWHDDDENKSVGELYDPEMGDDFLDPTVASIKEADIPTSGDLASRYEEILETDDFGRGLTEEKRIELNRLIQQAKDAHAAEWENRNLEAGVTSWDTDPRTLNMMDQMGDEQSEEEISAPAMRTRQKDPSMQGITSSMYNSFLKKQNKK